MVFIACLSGAAGLVGGLCTGGAAVYLGPRMARRVPYKVSVPIVLLGVPGAGLYAAWRAMPGAFRETHNVGSMVDMGAILGAGGGYGLGCVGILCAPLACRTASILARRMHTAVIDHLRKEIMGRRK